MWFGFLTGGHSMAGQGATPSLYCTCLVSVSLLKIVEKIVGRPG